MKTQLEQLPSRVKKILNDKLVSLLQALSLQEGEGRRRNQVVPIGGASFSTLILPPPPGTFQPRSVVSLLRSAPYSCALAIKVGHLKQSPEPVDRPGFLSRLCQYHALCTRLPLIDMCTPLSDRVLFGKFTPSNDSLLLV